MLKPRNLFYFALLIILTGIFLYEHNKLDINLTNLEFDPSAQSATFKKKGPPPNSTQDTNSSSSRASTPISAEPEKNFLDWFSNEAQHLEESIQNPQEKEVVLKTRVAQLSRDEIKFLRKKSTDKEATANERISATYLLNLSSSSLPLYEIAKEPLSLPSPQPVHSLGETLLMQEKAIRVMVIDELFNRAKTDVALRSELLRTINQIQDEGLKHYALKRYQELK